MIKRCNIAAHPSEGRRRSVRIIFLAKRHPQQRDLITRPYGRFHHLPVGLAALGHDVRVQLCGYRHLTSEVIERDGIIWSSHDFLTLGFSRLLGAVESEIRAFQPDWIIGCSDAWAGWLAHRMAHATDCKLAIDAYDNYEAYLPANLPLHWLWRRALRAADLVIAAGPQLAEKLGRSRRTPSDVHIIPMCADPNFFPIDRGECRRQLGLPQDLPLFGYSGGWTKSRGSDLVLDAFVAVRKQLPESRMVLTGKPPQHATSAAGVINLGYIDDASMPLVANAVDLSCIVLADTAFGRYSYPAKLCEAMACGVPVVASATAAASWMLNGDVRFLAPVGDAAGHAHRMLTNCSLRAPEYRLPPSWDTSALRLEQLLAGQG
jgi:glycosyltransferase involved in cell wall biosynthesis